MESRGSDLFAHRNGAVALTNSDLGSASIRPSKLAYRPGCSAVPVTQAEEEVHARVAGQPWSLAAEDPTRRPVL